MFVLDVQLRLVRESCQKCWGPMYTLHFPCDGWFSFIAGTLPICVECHEKNDS